MVFKGQWESSNPYFDGWCVPILTNMDTFYRTVLYQNPAFVSNKGPSTKNNPNRVIAWGYIGYRFYKAIFFNNYSFNQKIIAIIYATSLVTLGKQ